MKTLLACLFSLCLLTAAEPFAIDSQGKQTKNAELAAKELHLHLEKFAPQGLPAWKFHVGYAPAGAPKAGKWESICLIRGKEIWFYGNDRDGRAPSYGSLFAVYTFLEKYAGAVWPRPGDDWISFTRREFPALPAEEVLRFVPPLQMNELRIYDWQHLTRTNNWLPPELRTSDETAKQRFAANALWNLRMRLNTTLRFRYGHAFGKWQQMYGKTHPEYLGLNRYGTRGLPRGQERLVKLCVSNPKVVDQVIENWVKAGKPKYFNVCPNDGTPGYCFCPECAKLDAMKPGENFYAHKTDRELNFWNRITARARKLRPDVMVVTYLYSYYRFPPRREKVEYPDNMLFGIVPAQKDDAKELFDGWKKAGVKHCFLRPNSLCYHGVVPRGLERYFANVFQQARSCGVIGCDYDSIIERRPLDLERYVLARLMAEPDAAFEQVFERYVSSFGGAADTARCYYTRIRERGERGAAAIAAKMNAEKLEVLDDGEMSGFAIFAHDEKSLEKDLALLRAGLVPSLDAPSRARLENLIIQAEHQLLTYRFLKAGEAGKGLEEAGKKLLDFRIKNRDAIADNFGTIFARLERKYWLQLDFYRERTGRGESNPIDPGKGWRASFDAPGLMGWKPRDLYEKVTSSTASFDKYSVECRTTEKEGLGIWCNGVELTPGAKYTLSADFQFDPGATYAGVRVAANNKTIARLTVKRQGEFWQSGEITFTVPVGVKKAAFYVFIGPGAKDSKVRVDNILLTRQSPQKEKSTKGR